jgi:hypothetical protein
MGYGAFAPDLRWNYHGDRAFPLAGGQGFRLDLPAGWSAWQAAVSPDGRLVAQMVQGQTKKEVDGKPWYSVESRGVVIHEAASGKQVLTLPTGLAGPIAFTPDGRGLVVTDTETITRWDLTTQKPAVRHRAPGAFTGS